MTAYIPCQSVLGFATNHKTVVFAINWYGWHWPVDCSNLYLTYDVTVSCRDCLDSLSIGKRQHNTAISLHWQAGWNAAEWNQCNLGIGQRWNTKQTTNLKPDVNATTEVSLFNTINRALVTLSSTLSSNFWLYEMVRLNCNYFTQRRHHVTTIDIRSLQQFIATRCRKIFFKNFG